ncbi:thioredoxin domain-containing protein [uncultured Sulfitobacter sp.]|uniref:DsbA family protein n=1 Tax=uncultured Sulfitobacter sp. TaxID=191468 RepID=UPI002613B80B|nr:thioredoxin domain-containing protein [uncultured Sulfitobacter sp.]
MNRKTLILATLAVVLAVFAAGAWFVSRPNPAPAATAAPLEQKDRLIRAYSPVLGREDAPVTIVEFFDPACEACRAFHPIVKQILEQYPDDVRVVMRYTPFHGEGSELAIKVLEAARLQKVFIPVLEALLENQSAWASHGAPAAERIMEIAGAAGLDTAAAADQIRSPSIVGVLNQDRADVEAVGVRQTPTFFVNGKPLPDFGAEQLLALVRSEVAATAGN